MSLRRFARLCLCALAAGAVLLTGCSLGTTPPRCTAEVNRKLAQLSVPKSEVRSIREAREGSGGKNQRNETLTAWVRLSSCSGNLVMTMTGTCFVRQAYTTGDCRVEGLPHF